MWREIAVRERFCLKKKKREEKRGTKRKQKRRYGPISGTICT
jgi:hypothetical protein